MANNGAKTKAGKLLTKFLRQISEEKSELIKGDQIKDDRMASKAEALARNMWDMALGKSVESLDEKGLTVYLERCPDKSMMSLIFDRLEGKAPISITEEDEVLTIAGKVTEEGKKRIAQAGKLNE